MHLFPAGEMIGRDGRQFNLASPLTVMAAFEAGGVDLPVDYEHQSDQNPQLRSGPVPAAGWIKELKADARGLWGRVEWTGSARELIAQKAYRYISPSFYYTRAGKVITRLKGAGLVHKPNLQLKALAAQEEDMNPDTAIVEQLAALLKLPPDATGDDVLSEVESLLRQIATPPQPARAAMTDAPDPARFVPVEAVADLIREGHANRAAITAGRAEAKVADALARGFITPAMRDWATALCSRDEASFDTFLANTVPAWGHLATTMLPDTPSPGKRAASASPTAAAICAQLGLEPGTLKE